MTLRVLWWDGKPPAISDVLQTSTGRSYVITSATHGQQRGKSFSVRCLVMPPDYYPPDRSRVHRWTWGKRNPAVRSHPGRVP